ncbi:hypothetical protein NEMBOFW57_007306 [Staphylotrichum longicolle]|uniref:Uncharacterized protein n=1 Tax=Staphylotrichum longicolle TaxID=669026 RepID=A0AAD4HYB6_9PEZI|nr:hypothetical protein NEMBOFW57_007306 [Staphylotrichum longicolle]
MPRLTRRLSHSTPPSITSSRYLNDDRHDRSRDRNASYPRRRNRHSRSRSRSRSRSISPYYTSGDSRSASPSPTRSKPKSALTIAQEAAHHAFEAGAIAALRLRNDPSPWLGKKGGQIAAAAIGAAVVDTFVARRIPKRKGGLRHSVARQAAQMVIGGLVSPSQDGKGAKGKVNGAKGRMKGAVRTGRGARGRR